MTTRHDDMVALARECIRKAAVDSELDYWAKSLAFWLDHQEREADEPLEVTMGWQPDIGNARSQPR